jgi:hypothetical protein
MRAVLLVIAFSGALGCAKGLTPPAAAPDAAARSRPSPLRAGTLLGVPGENIEYVVSLRGFTLGTVIVAVGQIGEVNGHRAVVVRSRGSGSGAFALFDIGDALTEEETIDAELVGEKVHEHQKRNIAGESTYNVHSAAGALRAWRSKIDDTSKFDVRISDIYLSVELTDVARERHGDLPAVRYDGVASATGTYKLSIWISDDEARVPLKFTSQTRWGEMVVEMVSYDVARDFASNP